MCGRARARHRASLPLAKLAFCLSLRACARDKPLLRIRLRKREWILERKPDVGDEAARLRALRGLGRSRAAPTIRRRVGAIGRCRENKAERKKKKPKERKKERKGRGEKFESRRWRANNPSELTEPYSALCGTTRAGPSHRRADPRRLRASTNFFSIISGGPL